MQQAPTQQEKQSATEADKEIPQLKGAAFYLAVPAPGQPWQMCMFNYKTWQWQLTGIDELKVLANQMGMQPAGQSMAPTQQSPMSNWPYRY